MTSTPESSTPKLPPCRMNPAAASKVSGAWNAANSERDWAVTMVFAARRAIMPRPSNAW